MTSPKDLTPPTAPVRSDYDRDDIASRDQLATLDRLIEEQKTLARSDYERDDIDSQNQIATFRRLAEKRKRLPTPAEQDEMSGRDILEGLQELVEERRESREKIVR
jgi:hypothetical protein